MAMGIAGWAAAVSVTVAAIIDVRTRRVPNVVSLGSAGMAMVFLGLSDGWTGLSTSMLGWLTGIGLLFPLFLLRGLGAGDVKLLGAVGAWLGPLAAARSGLFAVFAGGLLALIVALRHRYLAQAFANLSVLVTTWRVQGPRPVEGLTLQDATGPRLAYATAIAAGTFAALWLS